MHDINYLGLEGSCTPYAEPDECVDSLKCHPELAKCVALKTGTGN